MNPLFVVTGGSKGIGRALVERFAKGGFDIVTCARQTAPLEALQREVQARYPVRVWVKPADMANRQQVLAFAAFVRELQRPVEVLVNNAGFFVPGTTLEEPEGSLEGMIEANVYSAYYTTRGIAPLMKAAGRGHIFNMCSIASIKAYPNGGSYAIAKFALLGFSKVLREELKPHGVRVTAILPGATKTASWAGTDLPDSRFMKVEDVAETVFYAHSLSPNTVVEEILLRPQLGDI